MTAIIWLIALGLGALATITDLLVRYGNLHGRWWMSHWCQLLLLVNLGAIAVSLLVLHGAGFRPAEGNNLANALALLLADTTGLGVLRAGTFAGSIEPKTTGVDVHTAIASIEQGVTPRIKALLSFLMAKADEDVQDRHDAWRTAIAERLLALGELDPDRMLDGLMDAHNAVRQLDEAQTATLSAALEELEASTLSVSQQARAFVLRSIEVTGEKRTQRALRFLCDD